MALVIQSLYNYYQYLFNEHKDPRVEHYPLLKSPLPVFGIIIIYLYFVMEWGPKFMKNRQPYELKGVIMLYNLTQIIVNLIIGTCGFYWSYLQKDFSLTCQLVSHNTNTPTMRKLIFITYFYYMVKIFDLLDTVFFVLRKKNNQITFLHVYHHSGMVFALYIFGKFLIGSHGTLLGLINAYVHVIMYSYYFLTSFKPELKRSIWWKKHITQVQLVQFLILIFHFGIPIFRKSCTYPTSILFITVIQNVFMFALFTDFYIKAYVKKRPKVQKLESAD